MSRNGKIPYQQLTTDNFKGTPDPTDTRLASTRTGITVSWSFRTNVRVDGKYESTITDIRHESYFAEEESWWRNKTINGDLLRHEQGHFDIAEIFVRELNANKRELMDQVKGEGDTPEEAEADLHHQFARHAQRVNHEQRKRQDIYDYDTDYNKNSLKQEEWNRKLHEALNAGHRPKEIF
jgi:predicted secreted Zn-dependent protease